MTDASASYFAALAAIRLKALLTGDRWPVEADDNAFDPMADANGNYAEAWRQIRLLTLMRADRWPSEHDEFDIVLAAELARIATHRKP